MSDGASILVLCFGIVLLGGLVIGFVLSAAALPANEEYGDDD